MTVNHSISFKDYETGAHTNTIESYWRHCKVILPRYHCDKKFFAGYLAKYMFLKYCRNTHLDPTIEFLKCAWRLYDPTKYEQIGFEDNSQVFSEFSFINSFN